MSSRTTSTQSRIPGLLNVSLSIVTPPSSNRKPPNPTKRKSSGRKPVKGIFEVPLPFPQQSPSSSAPSMLSASINNSDPKLINAVSSFPSAKIQQPSGRIARARAHRLASSSTATPATPSPPQTDPFSPPSPTSPSPRSATTSKPRFKPKDVKARDRPRARTKGKEKYRRGFKDDITVDLDMFMSSTTSLPALATSPPPPSLPTPPTTPQRSVTIPQLRSSGSWERYANSTFQHSPSPNSIPRPKFMMDMDVDEL